MQSLHLYFNRISSLPCMSPLYWLSYDNGYLFVTNQRINEGTQNETDEVYKCIFGFNDRSSIELYRKSKVFV